MFDPPAPTCEDRCARKEQRLLQGAAHQSAHGTRIFAENSEKHHKKVDQQYILHLYLCVSISIFKKDIDTSIYDL